MTESVFVKKTWIQGLIVWLLLLIPLSFKIEFLPGLILLPQEIILPVLILIFLFPQNKINRKQPRTILPYIYLLIALLSTTIVTIFSLLQIFDIIGLLKLFKYSLYVISIIIISNYRPKNFVNKVNVIAIVTIAITLLMYYVNKVNSGQSWSTFTAIATYKSYYMPTGFSNRIFNLQTQSFVIYSGNHGIYGSYLVLILFLNLSALFRKANLSRINYIAAFLAFVNIMLLTSRETFLLIFVTFFSYAIYYITYRKFKPSYVVKVVSIFSVSLLVLVWFIIYYDIQLSIVNKMVNSIRGFRESGGDGSVNVRFNTWLIIFIYLFTNPWRLITGTGFNPTLYRNRLDKVAELNPVIGDYVGIPESLFIEFLSYGGIIAFVFIILFVYSMYKNLLRNHSNKYGMFLPFYMLGLIITNNTGASLVAELLMTQLALVYFFIVHSSERSKYFIHNS